MMERLPHIQELLLKDLTANYNGDPAASSRQEIILSYPGMFAIFIYRIAHELYLEKVPMIPRIMTEYAHSSDGHRHQPRRDHRGIFLHRPRHRRGRRRDDRHR